MDEENPEPESESESASGSDPLGRPHHYGVVVSDMDRAVDFYRDVLGFAERERFPTDPERFGDLLGVDSGAADVAFLDAGGFLIELEAHEGSERNRNDGANDDVGTPHLCLAVADIEAAYEDLRDDAAFVSPPGKASESGATIAYLTDPDGNLIELIEDPAVE